MALKLSVSGLRGIVGDDLTPEVVVSYTRAFARWAGRGEYILARDPRPHGLAIYHLVAGTLAATGSRVVHLGMVPTPTGLLFVRKRGSAGGVIITASHNPQEWNALKFVKRGGAFPLPGEIDEIKSLVGQPWGLARHDGFQDEEWVDDPLEAHLNAILGSRFLDPAPGLRVAVDAVNGAGSIALPRLLSEMGAEVHRINCRANGVFPHPPEPKKEHLPELDALLTQGEADLGFACDPDADRLLVGTRARGLLSEEHTLPLVAWAVLSVNPGTVITNFSTSMMVDRVAERFGSKVKRVPVGEAYLFDEMRKHDSPLAGEGGGGIIVPEINPTRDSLAAAGVILSLARRENLDDVVSSIPSFPMKKLRFPGEDPGDTAARIQRVRELAERLWPSLEKDYSDGVYVRGEAWWVHVRPSNTEPIIRLYAEGDCDREVEAIRALLV